MHILYCPNSISTPKDLPSLHSICQAEYTTLKFALRECMLEFSQYPWNSLLYLIFGFHTTNCVTNIFCFELTNIFI
jgi:hypothetical protein